MHSSKFESKEALVAYAKQNGLTCLSESFAKWQQLLSPKEYLLFEVRTSDGVRPAMLLPNATFAGGQPQSREKGLKVAPALRCHSLSMNAFRSARRGGNVLKKSATATVAT